MSTHAGKRGRDRKKRRERIPNNEIVRKPAYNYIPVTNDMGREIGQIRNRTTNEHVYLSNDQKKTFLSIIEAGGNYATALKIIEASRVALKNTLSADKDFAELYYINCEARPGYCEMNVYEAARDGNLNACLQYINIHRSNKSDKRLIKAEKREIIRKEEELRRQAGIEGFTDKKANTSALSDGEWKSFLYLHEMMEKGRMMSDDQKLRYFDLVRKMFAKSE